MQANQMISNKSSFDKYFSTQVQENVQTTTQIATSYGFKQLNARQQQDVSIVEPQYALETLKQFIQNILHVVNDNELRKQLQYLEEKFRNLKVDTKYMAIFQTRNPNTHVLSISRIQLWKKKTMCLLAYKVAHFEYQLAPKYVKVTNSSSYGESTKILFFGSSSYEKTTNETLVEVDRGIAEQDKRILMQLSSLRCKEIDKTFTMFALK